ncbi:unnamed protein product [Ectocarpus sp. 8 AP-2014]
MLDPREDAQAYIEEHNINKLFQELGTRVMYHRPKDPNKFLLEVLGTLQSAQGQGTPTTFFTDEDIDAMFSLFDPTGRGHISHEQYENALKTLGIDDPSVGAPKRKRISKDQFRSCISKELLANSVTA